MQADLAVTQNEDLPFTINSAERAPRPTLGATTGGDAGALAFQVRGAWRPIGGGRAADVLHAAEPRLAAARAALLAGARERPVHAGAVGAVLPARALEADQARGTRLEGLSVTRPTLEDVYLQLTEEGR